MATTVSVTSTQDIEVYVPNPETVQGEYRFFIHADTSVAIWLTPSQAKKLGQALTEEGWKEEWRQANERASLVPEHQKVEPEEELRG